MITKLETQWESSAAVLVAQNVGRLAQLGLWAPLLSAEREETLQKASCPTLGTNLKVGWAAAETILSPLTIQRESRQLK